MKILITGGFGFIGSHLYDKLKYSNKVFRLGRTLKAELQTDLLNFHNSELIRWLEKEKPDLIYHLAGKATVNEYNSNYIWQHNIDMTANLLRAMVEAKSEARLIYSSSATVYSNKDLSLYADETCNLDPESPYGASKAAGELLIKTFAKTEQIKPACILRLVATVGSRANHGIVPDVIEKVRNSKDGKIQLIGQRPGSSKPFVHVSDVVGAMDYFGVKQITTRTNIIYNISNIDALTAEDVGEIIVDEMQMPRFVDFGQAGWAGDNNKVRVNNTFAKMNGWQPTMNSAEAVRQAVIDILKGQK